MRAIVGAVLTDVAFEDSRVRHIELATGSARCASRRRATWTPRATPRLSYEAGFEVREPDAPVFGSLNFVIEDYDADAGEDRHRRRPRAAGRARQPATGWCATTAS